MLGPSTATEERSWLREGPLVPLDLLQPSPKGCLRGDTPGWWGLKLGQTRGCPGWCPHLARSRRVDWRGHLCACAQSQVYSQP